MELFLDSSLYLSVCLILKPELLKHINFFILFISIPYIFELFLYNYTV